MTFPSWTWYAAALLGACGGGDDDGGSPDACGFEAALDASQYEGLGKLAVISLQERATPGGVERLATAAFMDFSAYDADDAPIIGFGPACTAIVGDPVVRTEPTVLESPTATLSVEDATTDFEEVDTGRLVVRQVPALETGARVAVDVVGGAGASQFPSFSAALDAPSAPDDLSGDAPPGGSFVVRWAAGQADAVEVELRVPESEEDTRIRCVVLDDGCLTVSSDAASWLTRSVDPVPLDVRASAVSSTEWRGSGGEIGYVKIERRRDLSYVP